MYRPPNIESAWLRRGLWGSFAVHLVVLTVSMCASHGVRRAPSADELIAVQVAPPTPNLVGLDEEMAAIVAERAAAAVAAAAAAAEGPAPATVDPNGFAGVDAMPMDAMPMDAAPMDAAPDAVPDAVPDARVRADAALVATGGGWDAAPMDAPGASAGLDGAAQVATGDAASVDAGWLAGGRDAAGLGRQDAGAVTATGGLDAARLATDGALLASTDAATVMPGNAPPDPAGPATGPTAEGPTADPGTGGDSSTPGSSTGIDSVARATGASANLLAYAPAGHVVTAMVRFDRLRGTRWAARVERLFQPMPDYQTLIGGRALKLSELFHTLVISSPEPQDPRATSLVARLAMARPALRDVLDEPETPVSWAVTTGGMHGKRGPGRRVLPGDLRTYLGWQGAWLTLAPTGDLPGLLAPAEGALDTAEATASLPTWLTRMVTIERESGAPTAAGPGTGPVLVVTLAQPSQRFEIPVGGLGVSSIVTPKGITIALQIESAGFQVRGNLKFANDASAAEFVTAVQKIKVEVLGSLIFKRVLASYNLQNAVLMLNVRQQGDRVEYATTIATHEAIALLQVAATMLDRYFAVPP